jgi:hypothetical protein
LRLIVLDALEQGVVHQDLDGIIEAKIDGHGRPHEREVSTIMPTIVSVDD